VNSPFRIFNLFDAFELRAGGSPSTTSRYVPTLSGSQYWEFASAQTLGDGEYIEIDCAFAESGDVGFFGTNASTDNQFWYDDPNGFSLFTQGQTKIFGTIADPGLLHTYRLEISGKDVEMFIDGVSQGTVTFPANVVFGIETLGLIAQNTKPLSGQIFRLDLNGEVYNFDSGSTLYELPEGGALGPELVTDGGFDDPGEWDEINGGSVTGGKAVFTGTNHQVRSDASIVTSGTTYVVSFTAGGSGGTFNAAFNSLTQTFLGTGSHTDGAKTYIVEATTTGNIVWQSKSGTTDLTIDDASVKALPSNALIATNFTSDNWDTYTYQTQLVHDGGTIAAAWVGPELLSNGDFSNGLTGWALSNVGGSHGWRAVNGEAWTDDQASTAYRSMYQDILEAGKTYIVDADLISIDSEIVLTYDGDWADRYEITAADKLPHVFEAQLIRLVIFGGTDQNQKIDNVSCKHLIQTAYPTNDFVMLFNIASNGETLTIPAGNTGTYNAEIDWGDGSTSTITAYNDADLTHTYANSGQYEVRISGSFPWLYFNNGGDKDKLLEVRNLGKVGWLSFNGAFYGCSNLTTFTSGNTDTSSVTNIRIMFNGATSANPDTSAWDTSSVTNMAGMFQNATSANPDVSSWDTSSVTNMRYMFSGATSANPDVSSWDTSSVTNMGYMFSGATSANPDTSGWDFSSVTNMANFFNSTNGLSTAVYDATLINMDSQTLQSGVNAQFGNSTYSSGGAAEAARTSIVNNDSWTITDGGPA